MIEIPHTRSALWSAPLVGVAVGPVFGLLYVLPLGLPAAAALALVVSLALGAAAGYGAWRSSYGTTQGLLSGTMLLLLLVWVAGGAAGSAAAIGRGPAPGAMAPWIAAAAGCVLLAAAAAAKVELLALQQQGPQHVLWRESVDWARGHVAPLAAATGPQAGSFWRSPWLIGALAANTGMALQAAWSAAQLLRVLGPALTLLASWAAWQLVGPLLARAWALRQYERQRDVRLVHRDLESLQALRRWRPATAAAPSGSAPAVPPGGQAKARRHQRR